MNLLLSSMVVHVKQTWWHIEEIYFPTNARIIHQVIDLFTDENEMRIALDDEFVGLKVFARNSSNREISFLEEEEEEDGGSTSNLVLNLDPLDSFPISPECFLGKSSKNKSLRHVKIEIEYILTNPKIETLRHTKLHHQIWGWIWDKLLHKKMSSIEFFGKMHPEFYCTFPLGWRMGGGKLFTRLFNSKKDKEGHSVGMKCNILHAKSNKILALTPSKDEFIIKFNKPFIKLNGGNRTYNYLIHADCVHRLKQEAKRDPNANFQFTFTYRSQISFMMVSMSLIPFLLFLPFSIICLYLSINSISVLNSNFAIGYFILLTSFSVFYYSLIKEGYNIPYKYLHIPIFLLSIVAILFIILMDINLSLHIYPNNST